VFISYKVIRRIKGSLHPDSETLEVTWTALPVLILLTIAFPRIYLLCIQDARNQIPGQTIKVVRNQWNWQRETAERVDHLLDSEGVDVVGSFDSPLLINRIRDTRILTIRTDVLHSLGIPRLAVKLDAAPGRIRITILEVSFPGVFIGSCYELCGRGHRAIPLHISSL
jgi:cytochrome c oxidase subunit 2